MENITKETEEQNQHQIELKNIETSSLSINPFQENFMNKIKEINEITNSDITPDIENKIEKLELEKISNSKEEKNDDFVDENIKIEANMDNEHLSRDKKISLPKVIEKIRNLVTELNISNNIISTNEIDLEDQYQIVINIRKE